MLDEEQAATIDGVREDLEAAQEWDRAHKLAESSADLLDHRYRALQEAIEQHGIREQSHDAEDWTPYPVRQAALELASACTMLSARLPRPVIPAKQEPRA